MAVALAVAVVCAAAGGAELVWDAATYLRIPVQLGADTRLVMPEPFDDAWEREGEVACTLLDAQTLIIRPRVTPIEQRLTLRGRRSGSVYLARVSSALPYVPLLTVSNPILLRDEASRGGAAAATSVPGLIKAMMQGLAPPGFQIEHSQRVLLDEAPYRVTALELWRSNRLSGVLARLDSTLTGQALAVVPANIRIRIPELGSLRAMGADDYELGASRRSTRVYLVYAR